MKRIKHFIWDFDGTLFDTYPNITGYLQRALKDFGRDVSQVEILEKMMENIPYAINFYAEKYGIPELEERYRQYYAAEKEDGAKPFPFVKETLAKIVENGGFNYIFTNRGNTALHFLDKAGISEYFTEVVTARSPEFVVKPAPDSILYLMKKYGGSVENTAMVGDRYCDLESGERAGCKTIHLLTPSVLQYPPCDWRIRDFCEMLEILS